MTTWYCVAPFRQVYLDPQGISPCCNIRRQPVELHQWEDNARLRELQQSFLAGKTPSECVSCWKTEKNYSTSLRKEFNQDYQHKIFTDTKIEFVDYRSSNLCNFKCRSCSPVFSNGIAREVVQHADKLKKFHPIIDQKSIAVTESNTDWIVQNLAQINKLMFTGGEPTIMPSVRKILELVLDQDPTKQVLITTNASFTDDFWYQLVDRMPNLHWTVSIDAVGPAAEIVRHGTRWSVVEHNTRWLAEHSASMLINSVVSNLTVMQLKPLLMFVADVQAHSNGRNGCDHRFCVLQRPDHLSADNLTSELKDQALNQIKECHTLELADSQRDMLQGLEQQLIESSFDQVLWAQSCDYNSTLDQVRQENYQQLFTAQQ
jgi:hypothetical protein